MEEEFYEELLIAGQEVMERNPYVNFEAWMDLMMKQYPAEIVDALGTNPKKVYSSLLKIWNKHLRGSVIA